MTYLTFLLLFLALPIVLLAAALPPPRTKRSNWRSWYALPLVCALALLYTTPWDNYLVYREVWNYGAERVLAVIGFVPLEEYLFFLLQPLLTGLFLYHLLARQPSLHRAKQTPARWIGTVVYLLLFAAGVILLATKGPRTLYLGLILTWAGPVLAGTWYVGGALIWQQRGVFLLSTLLPTGYLWIADRLAIGLGIWYISDRYSLGYDPLGLPIEEAVFFLFTNLLVVQGTFLFLYGDQLTASPSESPRPHHAVEKEANLQK